MNMVDDVNVKSKENMVKQRVKILFRTGFFHIFGSSVINKIISFASTIVLVRILTKGEYGVFTYSWNIFSILMLFNGLALESSVLQLCSEQSGDDQYAASITGYCMKFGLLYDLLLSAAIVGTALLFPLKINGAKELLLCTVLLPELNYFFNINASYFRSQKKNQNYSRIIVFNTSLVFICQVGGAFLLREKGLAIGSYVSALVTDMLLVFSSVDTRNILKKVRVKQVKEHKTLISIGVVSMINNGIAQMMYLLDVFVLGIVTSDEFVLAGYKVATIIPTALTFVPVAFVTYVYPYFAEHRMDGKWCLRYFKKILKYVSALNLCISSCLILFAQWIVPFIYGSQYNDSETIYIFRLLSANYFFSGTFRTISGNLLVTQRRLKYNMFVAIVSGLINVIGDYWLINLFGARGAAYTTIGVVIISSLMNTFYLVHVFKGKAKETL